MKPEELQTGITFCYENAKHLLDTAKLLLVNQRYAVSIVICIASLEESAKALMLKEYLDSGEELTKSQWRKAGFLSHFKKLEENMQKRGLRLDEMYPSIKGVYSQKPFAEWFAQEHVDLREAGLYVDRDFQSSQWISPLSHGWLGDDYWVKFLVNSAEESLQMLEEEVDFLDL